MATPTQQPAPVLAAREIGKSYGTTIALAGVDFDVRAGEVHALLGENGAGKSTLVKILSGATQPDSGTLNIDGMEVEFHSPQSAAQHGIAVVHQELSLLPNLNVDENICLIDPPFHEWSPRRSLGVIDRREMRRRTTAAAHLLDLRLPNERVSDLGPAQRQLVEIVRALARSAQVLLLDEPTSSLAPSDRWRLFERLRRLRQERIGVVFITHLLEEALALSDRITVLRDGRLVGTREAKTTGMAELIEMMTGRPAGAVFPDVPRAAEQSEPRLAVEHLASGPRVHDVSLRVSKGEIVGLAGLVGSGRTECLRALYGLERVDRGQVRLDGKPVTLESPRAAIANGIAFVPEDRQSEGLFPDETIARNIVIAAANTPRGERVTRFRGRILSGARITDVARRLAQSLQIKASSLHAPVSSLSGGNQQKVILARCLATRPTLVLADEPTRGVAISSKIEIYRLLRQLADSGAAVIFVSSEFEELIGLCSRVILIRAGRTVGETPTRGLDAEGLLNLLFAAGDASSPPSPSIGA